MQTIKGEMLNLADQDSLLQHLHPGLRHLPSVEQSVQAHLTHHDNRCISANADKSLISGLQSGRSRAQPHANPSHTGDFQVQSSNRPRPRPKPGVPTEVPPLTAKAGIAAAENAKCQCHLHLARTALVGRDEIIEKQRERSAVCAQSDSGQIRIQRAGGSRQEAWANHPTGWTRHGTAAISQSIPTGSGPDVR